MSDQTVIHDHRSYTGSLSSAQPDWGISLRIIMECHAAAVIHACTSTNAVSTDLPWHHSRHSNGNVAESSAFVNGLPGGVRWSWSKQPTLPHPTGSSNRVGILRYPHICRRMTTIMVPKMDQRQQCPLPHSYPPALKTNANRDCKSTRRGKTPSFLGSTCYYWLRCDAEDADKRSN